jgi:small subunit ribosomal protein S13
MPETEQKQETVKKYRHIVRVANTDLDGAKPIFKALTKIKGVSFMFSNLVCELTNTDKNAKTGELDESTIKKLDEAIDNPLKFDAPLWMLNRRKDYEDGNDKHLVTSKLDFTKQNDIRRLQKIKSYIGIRHYNKLPVRGQRTKSNFRRNKGKAAGVMKKSSQAGSSADKGKDKK